jgi:uncharacterized protein (TIGR02145 family)
MKSLFICIFLLGSIFFTSCDKQNVFIQQESGTFVDNRDGHIYQWANIGNQVWMVENLAYMPFVNPGTDYSFPDYGNFDSAKYYVHGYFGDNLAEVKNTDNYKTYGALYSWSAVMQGELNSKDKYVQGVCPAGWHVPGNDEWTKLGNYLGGENIAGGKLKSIGTLQGKDGLWWEPNLGAIDKDGFNGLPGSYHAVVSYGILGMTGNWWTSTIRSGETAWSWELNFESDELIKKELNMAIGFSVRCIRDEE